MLGGGGGILWPFPWDGTTRTAVLTNLMYFLCLLLDANKLVDPILLYNRTQAGWFPPAMQHSPSPPTFCRFSAQVELAARGAYMWCFPVEG